jgi:hypothetical protein
MSMAHELTSLFAGRPKSQSVRHIVEPALEQLEKRFPGDTRLPLCTLEDAAELPFLKTINAPELLFFAQLGAIVRNPLASLAMLARRIAPTLDRALLRHTARAFQKQLFTLSPTESAHRTTILCHCFLLVNRYSLVVKRGNPVLLLRLTMNK